MITKTANLLTKIKNILTAKQYRDALKAQNYRHSKLKSTRQNIWETNPKMKNDDRNALYNRAKEYYDTYYPDQTRNMAAGAAKTGLAYTGLGLAGVQGIKKKYDVDPFDPQNYA